jgi:hypothetical protein
MHHKDFLERMAIGKARALQRRNEGGGGGRVVASSATLYAHLDAIDQLALYYKKWKEGAILDAWYAVEYELFGDGWEGL